VDGNGDVREAKKLKGDGKQKKHEKEKILCNVKLESINDLIKGLQK